MHHLLQELRPEELLAPESEHSSGSREVLDFPDMLSDLTALYKEATLHGLQMFAIEYGCAAKHSIMISVTPAYKFLM